MQASFHVTTFLAWITDTGEIILSSSYGFQLGHGGLLIIRVLFFLPDAVHAQAVRIELAHHPAAS